MRSMLSLMHPVHNFSPSFPQIHSNIIFHERLRLPNCFFPSGFGLKLHMHFHLSHDCYMPAHFIILHWITLLIFGEA